MSIITVVGLIVLFSIYAVICFIRLVAKIALKRGREDALKIYRAGSGDSDEICKESLIKVLDCDRAAVKINSIFLFSTLFCVACVVLVFKFFV